MRILLVTACLIALVISAWSNYSTVADAKLRGDFTVKPTSLMTSTGHLPPRNTTRSDRVLRKDKRPGIARPFAFHG